MSNKSLHDAMKAKKDEFYTQLTDIEKELGHYTEHFRGKAVFCNCDDPFESNFFKYFVLNFNRLGLRKLVTTCYEGSTIQGTLFEPECEKRTAARKPYKAVVTSVRQGRGGGLGSLDSVKAVFDDPGNTLELLEGDGDFRSPECETLLDESDIVVTNPPFSLFREYIAQLIAHNKHFVVIGNFNAVTYKEVFPLIKNNQVWLGYHNGNMAFTVPTTYAPHSKNDKRFWIDSDGRKWRSIGSATWFTNLDIPKRHEPQVLYRTYKGHESDYPKFDNYDAVNVDKVSDIPEDYMGVMGVPITFLNKYDPDQFRIVAFRKGDDGKDLVFTRERERERVQPYFRVLVRRRFPVC